MIKSVVKIILLSAILLAFVSASVVSAQRCKITFKNTENCTAKKASHCTILWKTCAPARERFIRQRAVVSYDSGNCYVVYRGRCRFLRRAWWLPVTNCVYYNYPAANCADVGAYAPEANAVSSKDEERELEKGPGSEYAEKTGFAY